MLRLIHSTNIYIEPLLCINQCARHGRYKFNTGNMFLSSQRWQSYGDKKTQVIMMKMALALMGQWGRDHERGSFAQLGIFRRPSKRKCSHFQTSKWSRNSLEGERIENLPGRNRMWRPRGNIQYDPKWTMQRGECQELKLESQRGQIVEVASMGAYSGRQWLKKISLVIWRMDCKEARPERVIRLQVDGFLK